MKFLRHVFFALVGLVAARAQTASVTTAATTYPAAGGSVSFTVSMTYAGEASAVALEIGTVPPGWTFGATGGANRPQIAQGIGETTAFGFAYTTTPLSPISFTFSASCPAGLSGNQTFAGISAIFRFTENNVSRQVAVPIASIVLAPASGGPPPEVVAPVITLLPVGANLNEGDSYTLLVGASGTAPLLYQWRRDGVALVGVTGASLALTKVTPSSAGAYSAVVTNAAGSATSASAPITVKPVTVPTPPQITAPPASATVNAGANVTLSVAAAGTAPLTFQWRKDGSALPGATNASLSLTNVQPSAAGSYLVVVTNAVGGATSAPAVLAVRSGAPPQITAQPVSQTVNPGATGLLTVVASGELPLSYQWRKDGAVVSGATGATLAVTNVSTTTAGSYSVVVSNGGGSVTSNPAVLTVRVSGIAGTYVGTFEGNGGGFSLLVRADRTGVFVGYATAARAAVVSRNIVIGADGRFSVDEPAGVSPRIEPGARPPVAAQEGVFQISGAVAADGALTGAVPALNLSFSAPAAVVTGATAGVAGFYQSGVAGSAAASYAILSPAGDAMVVTIAGAAADGGRGTVGAGGSFTVTTTANARIAGQVGIDYVITSTVTPVTGTPVTFQGANADARSDAEKLINVSTRSRTGTATDSLIAGFIITGTVPKPVLVRAIGPTLANFGVGDVLGAARLEVFHGSTSLAVGNNWGEMAVAANEAEEAAMRVGAFALPRSSRDAALVMNLAPGDYTAVVTGQGGAVGVALVEVYDATAGPIPAAQRIINIATRARAGSGDGALIAGFVIAGRIPKRVLVRGAGPALAQFGVPEVLARPELALFAGQGVLGRNAGWSNSPDVAAITVAATQAGAFAFPVGSADTAILINLAPGAYTAQLSGTAGATGNALIEIYELP